MVALGFSGVFLWNVCFFAGMERVPASRGVLIMALNPIAISLGMWLVYGERMTGPLAWIAVALAGAAIVISHGDLPSLFTGALGPGEAFIFGSVLGWAVYTLIGRRVLGRISALATTTYAALFGTAMLAVGALVEHPWGEIAALPPKGWAAIAYLGVLGTVVAFLWFYEGVQRIGASRTGVFINLVPVFGVTFGALLLGEPVLASMVIGGLLVIVGVALTNRPVHAAALPSRSAGDQPLERLVCAAASPRRSPAQLASAALRRGTARCGRRTRPPSRRRSPRAARPGRRPARDRASPRRRGTPRSCASAGAATMPSPRR